MTARRSAGWQYQDNAPSVQRAIMAAVEAFSGEKVMVQGAGRTDAGVHALGQVAHFDLASERPPDTIRDALNAHLRPQPVAVLSAERVADNFDARRSAVRRHYLYRIANRRPDLALERGRAWRVPRRLDEAAMHAAAQRLIGKHDFTTFRSTECQAKSPEKTLDRLDVSRVGRRDPRQRHGALVPAQPGALDGRLAGAGRRRQMDGRRSRRRAGGPRPRRLRAGGAAGGLYLVRVDY